MQAHLFKKTLVSVSAILFLSIRNSVENTFTHYCREFDNLSDLSGKFQVENRGIRRVFRFLTLLQAVLKYVK